MTVSLLVNMLTYSHCHRGSLAHDLTKIFFLKPTHFWAFEKEFIPNPLKTLSSDLHCSLKLSETIKPQLCNGTQLSGSNKAAFLIGGLDTFLVFTYAVLMTLGSPLGGATPDLMLALVFQI